MRTRILALSAGVWLSQHTTALGFFNAMVERFPDRLNPGALWLGAAALYR